MEVSLPVEMLRGTKTQDLLRNSITRKHPPSLSLSVVVVVMAEVQFERVVMSREIAVGSSRGSFVQVEGCSDTPSEFSLGRAECRFPSVVAGLKHSEDSLPIKMLRGQKLKTCSATRARASINNLYVHKQ